MAIKSKAGLRVGLKPMGWQTGRFGRQERPKCWVSFARTEGFSAAHPKSQNIREHSGSAGLQPGSSKQNKPLNETQQSVCVNFWTALLFWSRRVQYQEELNVWLFRKSMHRQSFGSSRSFLLFFLFFYQTTTTTTEKTMIFARRYASCKK